MRRRANALSVVIGTRLDRPAQSNHCALHVRWSKGSDSDGREHKIPPCECALCAKRNAHRRGGVFSYLPNQASTAAPEVDAPLRRGRRTSSPSQFGQTKFICSEQLAQKVHS